MPLAYAAVSAALVIAVVAVAYGVSSPALGVAEFSPSAQSALSAPPTTGGPAGSGAAARSRRSTTTTAPAESTAPEATEGGRAAPTTLQARSRRCFGNPPQQTEDPMSPPCIPTIFEGDNGGATSQGVTATEIRIAMPGSSSINSTYRAVYEPAMNALIDLFNRNFEFYGRRIVPVWVEGSPSGPVASRALAVDVASKNVFGAATATWENGYGTIEPGFVQELARQHVVAITRNANVEWSDESVYDFVHPYAWSVFPSAEDRQRNFADFACTSLVGRTASHAGDATLARATRRFGILSLGQVSPPITKTLGRGLEACTDSAPVIAEAKVNESAARRAAIDKLKNSGVTTLFCACPGYSMVDYAFPEAAAVGFYPEWVINPNGGTGATATEYYFQSNYAQGRFGTSSPIALNMGPKLLPYQARLWFQSISSLGGGLLEGANLTYVFVGAEMLYDSLVVLASGIQGAGPNLTPETFAAGLMGMQFPNPGAGGPPYWQPSAGFGPGDHSFFDDYNVAWWNPDLSPIDTAYSTYAARPVGSWCYLGGGGRFHVGAYPVDADSRLFNSAEPCR